VVATIGRQVKADLAYSLVLRLRPLKVGGHNLATRSKAMFLTEKKKKKKKKNQGLRVRPKARALRATRPANRSSHRVGVLVQRNVIDRDHDGPVMQTDSCQSSV